MGVVDKSVITLTTDRFSLRECCKEEVLSSRVIIYFSSSQNEHKMFEFRIESLQNIRWSCTLRCSRV